MVAVQLVSSVFLFSAHAAYDLADHLLPPNVHFAPYVEEVAALATWAQGHLQAPLSTPTSFSQKSWDIPVVKAIADHLLESASDERSRGRLLGSTCKESGTWLQALHLSHYGFRMDDETVHLAVGLRLGAPLCYLTSIVIVARGGSRIGERVGNTKARRRKFEN